MIICCESYLPNSGNPYLCGDTFEPADLIALMDEAEVDLALTIPAPEASLPGWAPTDNAFLKDVIERHPRILGCCHVDISRGDSAVDEFQKTVTDWGFKGLKLSISPSETVDKLAEASAGLRVPVTIHTNGSESIYPRISQLADDHPNLVIVMEHMGYRYHVNQALEITHKHPNIFLGSTVVASAEPIVVLDAIERVGVEQMLFGSNAPWAIPRFGVEGMRRLKLGNEEESLVLGGNFQRIYGLEA